MEFELVRFDKEKDMELISHWMKKRGLESPDARFLPPTGAFVVDEMGRSICAGFLCRTDANTACIGNFMSDPDTRGGVRHEALNFLIMSLVLIAKEENFGLVTCSANIERVCKRYEELGFEKGTENVNHYRMELHNAY